MIIEHYYSKKTELAPWYNGLVDTNKPKPYEINAAHARGITIEEFLRRDAIVKEQAAKCPYKVGDLVYPHSLALTHKYGMCKVRGIVSVYLALPPSEPWPESDLPFLVHAHSMREPQADPVNATINFFQKEYPKA